MNNSIHMIQTITIFVSFSCTAEENLKAHYFEGDIILTPRQQKVLHNAFKYAHKRSDAENRALIKDVSRLWPDGKVPYAYASDIGNHRY